MKEINLNFGELKNILNETESHTGINLSHYAFSFIKRRTELFMQKNQIVSDTEFIYRINTSKYIADAFIDEIFVPGTELFRDPEMWNYLADNILSSYKPENEIKIALPHATDPDDLFSLFYLISKHNKNLNVNIYISPVTENLKQVIKIGQFNDKHYKASVKNIELLNFAQNSEDIFKKKETFYMLKYNFSGTIHYDTFSIFDYPYIDEFDVVICRNNLIYYNKEVKSRAFKMLTKSLKKGKWLIIGEKEKLDEMNLGNYKQVQKSLSIYKRKSFL